MVRRANAIHPDPAMTTHLTATEPAYVAKRTAVWGVLLVVKEMS